MPTAEQLRNPPTPSEGDGSTSVLDDDGSTTTTWPDGTVRVDYADQSSMITYQDGAILNLYPDGTRTLNDQDGNPLDPTTAEPLPPGGPIPTAPETGPDRVLRFLHGDEEIANVGEAMGLMDAFTEALEGEINPLELVKMVFEMGLQGVKAMATEQRGGELRGWCYGVLYGALDMGSPPEPTFRGSLQGPDQDELDRSSWREGVSAAQHQLADGKEGRALRNKVLLRVARDGGQPATTLNAMWQATCEKTEDTQLARAYPNLSWPQPTGA
jgi:hypothetical protein